MYTSALYRDTLALGESLPEQAAAVGAHFQSREQVGSGLVVTDHASDFEREFAKQWQRLVAAAVTERNHTADADEKLRLTNRVIRLQSIQAHASKEKHGMHIVSSEQLDHQLLSNLRTIYILTDQPGAWRSTLLSSRPGTLLVFDRKSPWGAKELLPKRLLEHQAAEVWADLLAFLRSHQINLPQIASPSDNRMEYIDTALERLLDMPTAQQFMDLFSTYRHAALQATPLQRNSTDQRAFQTLIVLARQVQAFSGGSMRSFEPTEDDPSFFLNDPTTIGRLRFSPLAVC